MSELASLSRLGKTLRVAAWTAVACSIASSAACYVSYRRDCAGLRAVAGGITADADSPLERVLALMGFVHQIEGSRKNPGRFIIDRLGATPIQVLNSGGDCADKSRLLCALLREVGTDATMAMCFGGRSTTPTHTLVEAEQAEGVQMIVDPAFGLHFPKPDGRGYYDLLDLRHDPDIVTRRVDELCTLSPPTREADLYYMRSYHGYERVTTINWEGNAILRLLHDYLRAGYGDGVYRLPRPLALEEPKLFMAVAFLSLGTFAFFGLTYVQWRGRARRGRTTHCSQSSGTRAGC